MKLLCPESEILSRKNKLPCLCYQCNEIFYAKKSDIKFELINNRGRVKFCTYKCSREFLKNEQSIVCNNCNLMFTKKIGELKKSKSGNHFCSNSCAATYNNKHKTKGNRRSKLEQYLETELTEQYRNLEILFNNKTTINSELDIYIPSLKLAFELNGIFHYEPIFGDNKLGQIQNNDNRKFQACLEQGIELCIIDTSQQKYFKELTSKKYLSIITNIINTKYF
jgi:hypothetical protein